MTRGYMDKKCYYEILEVDIEANSETIQKSFRNLVKQWHPDICRLPEAENVIKELNEAYDVLKDEYTRERYDSDMGYDLKKQLKEELLALEEKENFYFDKKNSGTSKKYEKILDEDREKGYSDAFSKFKTKQNEEKNQKKKPKEQKVYVTEAYDSKFTKWFFPAFIVFLITTIIIVKNKG